MKYESFIFNGLKVMAKVKVFVHAANIDANADATSLDDKSEQFSSFFDDKMKNIAVCKTLMPPFPNI